MLREEPWQTRICKHCDKEKVIERFPWRTSRGKRVRRHVCDLCIAKQSSEGYYRRKQAGRIKHTPTSREREHARSVRRHQQRMADPQLLEAYNAQRRQQRLQRVLKKAGMK